MIGSLLVLLVSLLVLSKASSWVVEHAIVLARFFRISEMAIGFLLVAIATSLPELSIGITGALTGNTGISVGNVLGANLADMALVLGVTALVAPIVIARKNQVKLAIILFAASALSLLVILNLWFAGLLLLAAFLTFSYFVLKEKISLNEKREKVTGLDALFSGILFSLGCFLLIASSQFVVLSASDLALMLGVSKTFIAATIISMGTTLPELSVAIAGVKKKKYDLVLGNVFGSCIVNLTLILGLSALIVPLQVNLFAFANLLAFTLLANGVVLHFMRSRGIISKREGFVLLGLYALFILFAIAVEAFT